MVLARVHIMHIVHKPTSKGAERMKLLTGRATASRLGVHENTLRNWEARGVIRAVHLPGSGFRRYPQEGVDRLAAQMQRQLERPSGTDEFAPETVVVQGQHDASLWEQ